MWFTQRYRYTAFPYAMKNIQAYLTDTYAIIVSHSEIIIASFNNLVYKQQSLTMLYKKITKTLKRLCNFTFCLQSREGFMYVADELSCT